MKKIFTLVLIFLLLFSIILSFTSCLGIFYDFNYTLSEDGTYYIVSRIGTLPDDVGLDFTISVTIPEVYNNLPVASIGDFALGRVPSLRSVKIPDSVTTIGNYAFTGCENLKSIEIPDSVTSIGHCAFQDCKNLKNIEIPDSVTSIGGKAFYGCEKLEYSEYNNASYLGNEENPYFALIESRNGYFADMHEDTRIIANGAFWLGEYFESVTIPDSITHIDVDVFSGFHKLTSIAVDENNTAYKSIDGNLYSKDGKTLVKYAIGKTATSFTIPDSVTTIGSSAFRGCDSLTSVYYKGTAAEWSEISIGSQNDEFTSATRYYYSETEPAGEGNYWHYDSDGNIALW